MIDLERAAEADKGNPHVENVCKLGQGALTCRYLLFGHGWECAKLSPDLKLILDNRVRANTIRAQGDNCDGQTAEFLNAPEL